MMEETTPIGQLSCRRMLLFDTAYTFEMLVERNLTTMVTSRDLDGYFEHIWSIHPFASYLFDKNSAERFGRPVFHEIARRHTIIEGKVGRFTSLAWFPALNFVFAQLDLMRLLTKLVVKEGIQIIRAEDAWYCGLFALIIARLRHLPLIVGVWGNPGAIRSQTQRPISPRLFRFVWVEKAFERFVMRRADRVMTQNADNRDFVISSGVNPERAVIFRLGNALADVHFSDPDTRADGRSDLAKLGIGDTPSLLIISRLEPLKLVDHVIMAAKILVDRGRTVKVVIVGDGRSHGELVALAERLDISNQIIFCGNQDQDWLARVIPMATAIISPLTGRALGEAALGGVPIVAYDIDWQSELVETGQTGGLVPYLNYEAMADSIESLLDNPEAARRMGKNLRRRALELLDREAAQSFQKATYGELLSRRARSGMR